MTTRSRLATLTALTAVSLAGAGFAQVTPERLVAAGSEEEAANWLMVHRTYDSNRFSPLNEINASNAADLSLAFAVPIGGLEPSGFGAGYMEATPLVDNGFMYVSDPWGSPYKIDVTSGTKGQILWVCDTGIEKTRPRACFSPTAASRCTATTSSRR